MHNFTDITDWKSIVIEYLDSVITDPSNMNMPTWNKLVSISGKSKCTLWREREIYDKYIHARSTKIAWNNKTKNSRSRYRLTLEEKIIRLEHKLEEANKIIDAHLQKYIEICERLEQLNLDPIAIFGELPLSSSKLIFHNIKDIKQKRSK